MFDIFKWVRLVPVTVGAAVAIWLIFVAFPRDGRFQFSHAYVFSGVCLVTFAIVAILRFALGALGEPTASAQTMLGESDAPIRNRIAPLVIGIGTAGILTIALAVMISVSVNRADGDGKVVLGIFSSVVPVFATWVGAVIAFYFSNESFRQAAQNAVNLSGGTTNEEIASTTRMIPFDKITKLILGGKTDDGTSIPANAGEIPMAMVRPMFGATISRVIVFDEGKRAKLIIRHKLDQVDAAVVTVADYLKLNQNQNATDAVNFKCLPVSASVDDGRTVLRLFNASDLFITDRGNAEEPVKGWVTDDRLA